MRERAAGQRGAQRVPRKARPLLPDFKLEFGTAGTQLLVADEISCDTCRLWLKESRQSLDKDVFRYERGDLITAYEEAAKRIL